MQPNCHLQEIYEKISDVHLGEPASRTASLTPRKPTSKKATSRKIAALACSVGGVPPSHSSELSHVFAHWRSHPIWESGFQDEALRQVTRAFLRRHGRGLPRRSLLASSPSIPNIPISQTGSDYAWSISVGPQSDQALHQSSIASAILAQWHSDLRTEPCWTHLQAPEGHEELRPIKSDYVEREVTQIKRGNATSRRVPLRAAVSETLHELVLSGDRKSGKTTAIQALAHHAASGLLDDYDQPIVVCLGGYAQALMGRPSTSLLEYFASTVGCPLHLQRDAAEGIRTLAGSNQRFILLLDQWNQIPAAQQAIVRERISRESDLMTTLIATVPGQIPDSMAGNKMMVVCRLEGLTKRVSLSIAARRLAVYQEHEEASMMSIAGAIRSNYQDFFQSPYWLDQTLSIFADCQENATTFDLTQLVEEIVRRTDWVDHDGEATDHRLTIEHRAVLAGLAKSMVFDGTLPRDSFSAEEIERHAHQHGCRVGCLLRSTLISRNYSAIEKYRFTFPAVRNYFAAQGLFRGQISVAPISGSQSVDLDAAHFDAAMKSTDRFPVLLHAARMSGAPVNELLNHAFRWLDCADNNHLGLIRLAQLGMRAEWFEAPGDPFARRLHQKCLSAINKIQSGVIQDRLKAVIDQTNRLAGARHGRMSVTGTGSVVLVEANEKELVAHNDLPRTTLSEQRKLESDLATMTPCLDDFVPSVEELAPYQVFALTDLLVEIACDLELPPQIRNACLQRLSKYGSSNRVVACARELGEAADQSTTDDTVGLIVKLNVGNAFTSFVERFCKQSSSPTRIVLLVSVLVSARESTVGPSFDAECTARTLLRQEVLNGIALRTNQEIALLEKALRRLNPLQLRALMSDDLERAAIAFWQDSIKEDATVSANQFRLASLLIMSLPSETSRVHFAEAMRVQSNATAKSPLDARPNDFLSILTDCLIDVDLDCMLQMAQFDPIIKDYFFVRLLEREWMWMNGQIVDHSGRIVATSTGSADMSVCHTTPEAVQEIAGTLPQRQRNDFLSYWYMVSEGDESYRSNDRETIYRDLRSLIESSVSTSLGEKLASCYEAGKPPAFATWRKNLSRVVQRCQANPQWSAYLHEIGLGLRRRKPR